MTFWDALERYHHECGRHKKGARQEQERIRALRRTSWGSKPLSRVTTSDIRHMRDSALARGLSGSSVRLLMCTVSVVYKYAKSEWGYRVTNPVPEVLMPKAPPPRSRRICGDELQRLLDECGRCRNHYVLPAVQVSLETGLRQSELLGLTWDDVDIAKKLVHLLDTKNGSPRWIPLTKVAERALTELPRRSERVFPITRSLLTQAWGHAIKRAGIINLRWHDLRHEALSRWAHHRRGDVHKLALISGHKTIQMSLRYVHPVEAELMAVASLSSSLSELSQRT